MKQYISLILIVLAFIWLTRCKGDDPCSVLANGLYVYPEELTDTTLTSAEFNEFWDIPENVLPCLTTENLITTILSYKYFALYMFTASSNGLQGGYEIMKRYCRGIEELETRDGALDVLIARYQSIDTINYSMSQYVYTYGSYKFYTYSLETFLAQDAYLLQSTVQQQYDLLTELFIKNDARHGESGDGYYEGPLWVMARLMYNNNHTTFLEDYSEYSLEYFVDYGLKLQNSEIKSAILTDATSYLELLKSELK